MSKRDVFETEVLLNSRVYPNIFVRGVLLRWVTTRAGLAALRPPRKPSSIWDYALCRSSPANANEILNLPSINRAEELLYLLYWVIWESEVMQNTKKPQAEVTAWGWEQKESTRLFRLTHHCSVCTAWAAVVFMKTHRLRVARTQNGCKKTLKYKAWCLCQLLTYKSV